MPAAITGRLTVCSEHLAQLTERLNDQVRTAQPDWEDSLRQLGAEIRKQLFMHLPNQEFVDGYTRATSITGLPEDAVRIRFVISDRLAVHVPSGSDPDATARRVLDAASPAVSYREEIP